MNSDVKGEATIQVINLLGQVVYEKINDVVKGIMMQEIQLVDAASGMYLVKVMINDEVYVRQIVYDR